MWYNNNVIKQACLVIMYQKGITKTIHKGVIKMMFLSNNARESAISNIERLNKIIAQIPGDHLSYTDAIAIGRYLDMLKNEIYLEMKEEELLINKKEIERAELKFFENT